MSSCSERSPGNQELVGANFPLGLAVNSKGVIYYGEFKSGNIQRLDSKKQKDASYLVTAQSVFTQGERGLFDLAFDKKDRLFVSYAEKASTLTSAQISVGKVEDGKVEKIWNGPPVTESDGGGSIAFTPDGRLALAIGNGPLPAEAIKNGKPTFAGPSSTGETFPGSEQWDKYMGSIVTIDPDNPQDIEVEHKGWYDPVAFGTTDDGGFWVADRAEFGDAEEIAFVKGGKLKSSAKISGINEPISAIVVGSRFYYCGSVSQELVRYSIASGKATGRTVLANDCALGLGKLDSRHIIYSNQHEIRSLEI